MIYSLIIFITDKIILDEFYFYADDRDKDLANWYQATGLLSMTFYLVLSLRHYARYKKLVFDRVSYAEAILFQWIRNFMIAFLGILILRVLFFILNPDWGEFGSQFWHYIAFSFVIFYISINGYVNAVKISIFSDSNLQSADIFSEVEEEEKLVQESPIEKDIEQWKEKILVIILENKLYENPKLTLSEVAKNLNTNTKIISSVINSGISNEF